MKKTISIFALFVLLSPLGAGAFPSSDKSWNECAKCHKLDRPEAEKIMKKFVKGGRLIGIQPAPLKGFWVLEIEKDGRRGGILVDYSKTYVAGQVAPIHQPERKVDFSKIPLSDAVVIGPNTAKRKVVVFTDPDCPYCRRLHEEMKKVLARRNDIAFYLMLFPLDMHKDAYKKAQSILCDKSAALVDDAFAGKSVPEPKCGNEQVEKIKALGRSFDITGTPAIIKGDGTLISGYLEADDLIEWIEKN